MPSDIQTTVAAEILSAFTAARRHDRSRIECEASVLQIFRDLATVIAARDEAIASLEASVEVALQGYPDRARYMANKGRIDALESHLAAVRDASSIASTLAQAAIHSAVINAGQPSPTRP